jgi:hypothetical protein
MKKFYLRALLEAGFIIFLFYSNLMMGEFERSGMGRKMGWGWAFHDIFTMDNFAVAMGAAVVGYVVMELLRRKL